MNDYKVADTKLLVIAERTLQRKLLSLLKELGYQQVAVAQSAEEALRSVEQNAYALALVDATGNSNDASIDLTTQLEKRNGLLSIIMIPRNNETILQQVKSVGPAGYLLTPVRKSELRATLEIAHYRIAYGDARKLAVQWQEEKRKTEALLAITRAIAPVSTGPELGRAIFSKLPTVFPFDEADLFHVDLERRTERNLLADYRADPGARNSKTKTPSSSTLRPLTQGVLHLVEHGPLMMSATELYQTLDHPHFEVSKPFPFQQTIAGPLKKGNKVIGMLCFWSKTARTFEGTSPLFKAISDQLSIALSNVLINEEFERRERFKTLQVELMRLFESSYELKNNYRMAGQLLRSEVPYDLLVAARMTSDSHQLQGGSFFFANEAEGHWLREYSLVEEITNQELLQHWASVIPNGTSILNGQNFTDSLPPRAPVRDAYQQLKIRSALLGRTSLDADSDLLVMGFSFQGQAYHPGHQELLYRLLPTLQLVTDRSLANHRVQQLTQQLQEENTYLEEEIKLHYNFGEIVGESEALQQVFTQVQQVAPTDSTVLVLGETGTGKELVCRAIHEQSPRHGKTLIKVNCAALPPSLVESELFGHERGAFTGAVQQRIGKFELAHDSTLFLDEVGELPLELQAKLLRVLQEKRFERLGSNQVRKANVRIVAATNRNLEAEVRQGNFRADLFYRLNVFPIHLPPLRQRVDDIAPLAQHFVHRYARKFKKPSVKRVAAQTIAALTTYSFPGNVRELEHLIERAVITTQTQEVSFTLPENSSPPDPVTTSNGFKTLRDNEREMILRVLAYTGGKIRGEGGAAAILDIKPTTLESRMERLGIEKHTRFV